MDRRLGVCGRYRLGRETDADAGAIHRGSESVQVQFVASQRTVSMGWTDQTASLVDLATESMASSKLGATVLRTQGMNLYYQRLEIYLFFSHYSLVAAHIRELDS